MVPKKDSILLLNNNIKDNLDFESIIIKKIDFYKEIIQKTLLYIQKNKMFDILVVNDITISMNKLTELNNKLNEIKIIDKNNSEFIISTLQSINNELSLFFKNYGTENLNDLLFICFGNDFIFKNEIQQNKKFKIDLLQKYFHPTGYKIINRKDLFKNKGKVLNTNDTEINEKTENFDCFDEVINFKTFHLKVYGIKIFIHHKESNKTLLIYGITKDIFIPFLNNPFINEIQKSLLENLPKNSDFDLSCFQNFLDSLLLKDYLININFTSIFNKYYGYLNQLNILKQKQLSQVIKEFIMDDIFYKRITLIQLLIFSNNFENEYLAYLLYDLLSNDSNNNSINTQEQTILYESLPWFLKGKFLQCSKNMIQYTNDFTNFDLNKITLEQQICLTAYWVKRKKRK